MNEIIIYYLNLRNRYKHGLWAPKQRLLIQICREGAIGTLILVYNWKGSKDRFSYISLVEYCIAFFFQTLKYVANLVQMSNVFKYAS